MESHRAQSTSSQSNRTFKRTFVFLDEYTQAVPTGKKLASLINSGRVVENFAFTKKHSASDIGRLLLAHFPSLLGTDVKSLVFIKSYSSGRAMATVNRGLISGETIVKEYSTSHKKKVYFLSAQPATSTSTVTSIQEAASAQVDLTSQTPPTDGSSTRRLLAAMAHNSQQNDDTYADDLGELDQTCEVDMDCVITSAGPTSVSHLKDHAQVLTRLTCTEEPEVVGDVIEDLTFFGLPSQKQMKGCGRTEEVARAIGKISAVADVPPFVTHTLEELLWQAREDGAVCLLVLLGDHSSEAYIRFLFKILNDKVQEKGKYLFWVSDYKSDEGRKVQSKYGVGEQTTMLILVPSHIPQCVDIFNEANIDHSKVKEAFANSQQLNEHLQNERMNLYNRRVLVREQDQAFAHQINIEQDQNEETTEATNSEYESEEETEVMFGPVARTDGDNLSKTVEDVKEIAQEKKTKKKKNKKNKKNKKKNKKNKKNNKLQQADKSNLEEPDPKKPRVE